MATAAGCGSTDGGKTLTFGAALPLTGGNATEGKKHQDGYNLWKDAVNAAGGIEVGGVKYRVDIKYYDYKSDAATAVKLVEKLITEDNIKLILGPFGSAHAKASSAVTEKYKVPMIAPSASSREVYTQGYKFLFGTFTPNETLTEPLTDIARAAGAKTLAVIARNDLFPLAIANAAKASGEARGMQVLYFDKYPIGATDLSPLLTQAKAKNPDWYFITGYADDLILAGRQMKELDVNGKMVTMIAGAAYKEFVDALKQDSDGVTTAVWWHPSVTYKGVDVFGTAAKYTEMFQKKYGYIPDYPIASASLTGVLFQEAIKKAGSTDPQKVRDALASLDIVTFFGPVRFDDKGQNTALNPPVLQIKGGQHVPVHPKEIKAMDLIFPLKIWKDRK